MKEKLNRFEIFYYCIAMYCLWFSGDLFQATVKFQGTENASFVDPYLFLVGAFAPITTMTSSLPVSGTIVSIFILLSPTIGIILYHDYKRKRFGVSCFILTAMVTSRVVTGVCYSPSAGLGGLVAPFFTAILFIVGLIGMVKDDIKKELEYYNFKR